ncbi:MAG: DUF2924 domain-containing protein [Armatimonadota bacterium]
MTTVARQVADLQNLSHEELIALWGTLCGGKPPAYNRVYIIKRLAYRIQEIAYGGLSEEAHQKMDEVLARHGYDENGVPMRKPGRRIGSAKPMPVIGSRFVREWNGRRYEVTALIDGFEFNGRKYKSLSAVAKVITGTHWNGRAFFGLNGRDR